MINFGFISLDILVFLGIIIILSVISFRSGKKPILALILSLYPSLLFFNNLPFIRLTDSTAAALGFVIIYASVIYIIWRNLHVKKLHSISRKLVDYILMSLSFVILLISIQIHSISSLTIIYKFSPFLTNIVDKIPYGLALAIPLFVILITNKNDF